MNVFVLLAALFAAQTTPSAKCYLSGIVVDARTGEPLPKTQLVLERPGRASVPAGITATDARGVFAFEGIDPGTYRLKAQRNGYLDAYFGARRSGGAGTTLNLEKGDELKELNFKLSRFGVIAGKIRDSGGEPLAETSVVAYKPAYAANGFRTFLLGSTSRTDDLGQFRIAGLSPGRYYIHAQPKPAPTPQFVDKQSAQKMKGSSDASGRALWRGAVAKWSHGFCTGGVRGAGRIEE